MMLGLSISASRIFAKEAGVPLWKYIEKIGGFPARYQPPVLFFNLINGGMHAKNAVDIQEYLLVVKSMTVGESIFLATRKFSQLCDVAKEKFGRGIIEIGDEGGLVLPTKSNIEPIELLKNAISSQENIYIGLDIAASTLYKENRYSWEGNLIETSDLINIYFRWCRDYNLFSIEDPFSEDDPDGFFKLRKLVGHDTLIVGDDLTATNPERIEEASRNNLISALIIKPNQIGTVSETLEAIHRACNLGLKTIVSHRSGETMDVFIADLAWGSNAFGLKAGAPTQPERLAKYNRLIEIEKSI
ncbi:MAG: hypothetical protein ACK4NX_02360 [Candidatus Paceibacteria bacterium]